LCNLQSPNTPTTTKFSKLLARGKKQKTKNQNQNKTKKKKNPHFKTQSAHTDQATPLLTSMMMMMMMMI